MDTEPYDLSALQQRIRSGWAPTFTFFWDPADSQPDLIGSACLSQWYPSPFQVDDIVYPTAEHYMMAAKARLFGDEDAVRRVLDAPHPRVAKQAGRAVSRFDEGVWQQHRFDIVVAGNRHKFAQNQTLRDFLLATGNTVLAEASPTDTVWGIGLAASDPGAQNPLAWRGFSLLGFALMRVRSLLAQP